MVCSDGEPPGGGVLGSPRLERARPARRQVLEVRACEAGCAEHNAAVEVAQAERDKAAAAGRRKKRQLDKVEVPQKKACVCARPVLHAELLKLVEGIAATGEVGSMHNYLVLKPEPHERT